MRKRIGELSEEGADEIPENFFLRRTLVLTYEQSEAINQIALERMMKTQDVTWLIIETGLAAIDPDVLERAKPRALMHKKRDFYKLPPEQREKYIKRLKNS